MAMSDGGAADLLGDSNSGGGGGAGDGGDGGAAATQGAGDGGQGGSGDGGDSAAAPDWFAKLSTTADGDKPSNLDYAASKNFKDLDSVFKSLRETETALRGTGRIAIPGADAKPEDVAAFRTAIGVPEKAEDYAFKLPEGHEGVELDDGLIAVLRTAAFDAGVPKGGFDKLAETFIKAQLDQQAAEVTRQDGLRDEAFAKWGAEKDAKIAAFRAGGKALGLDRDDVVKMQMAIGSDRVLNMLAAIGSGIGEDQLGDGGKNQFGVTGEQAKAEMDQLKGDPAFQAKVKIPGSPERLRWDRLNSAYANWRALSERAA